MESVTTPGFIFCIMEINTEKIFLISREDKLV